MECAKLDLRPVVYPRPEMLIDNTLCSLSADGTQWIYGQPRPRVAVSPGVPILLKSEYVLLSFVFSIVLGNAGGVQSGRKRRDKKLCQRADNRSFTVERSEQVRRNSLDKELLLRTFAVISLWLLARHVASLKRWLGTRS